MTNYERIKNMTVEEMAEMLLFHSENCRDFCVRKGKPCRETRCIEGIKEYLKAEVEE